MKVAPNTSTNFGIYKSKLPRPDTARDTLMLKRIQLDIELKKANEGYDTALGKLEKLVKKHDPIQHKS